MSILHRLVRRNAPRPQARLGRQDQHDYVHLVEEVVEGSSAGRYPLAALVMPATVDHVRTISMARRTDAGQEHLLLPEAAQRAGDQSAGVKVATRFDQAVPWRLRLLGCCGLCAACRVSRETGFYRKCGL